MKRQILATALSLTALASLTSAACVSNDDESPPTAAADASLDVATSRVDASHGEVDGGAHDTSVADTSVADTSIADTSIADTNVADTSVADTSVADTSIVDTGGPDTSDTALPDAADAACTPIAPGMALAFDPTSQPQYVSIADATVMHLTSALTIEAWFNVSGALANGIGCIECKPSGTGTADTTAVWLEAASLNGGINPSNVQTGISTPWSAADGTWHHVALTYDAATTTQRLYLDGALKSESTAAPAQPAYDAHALLFGADVDNGGVASGFHGVIDDVRIYSTARTLAQIGDDMAGCQALGDPALVGYWPFDEGTGNVAHDATANHLDGTLGAVGAVGSAPTWVTSTAPF